jgi:hypothetical protein
MDININVSFNSKLLNAIIFKLNKIENNMATAKEVFDAALAQQEIIAQGVQKVTDLVNEVKQLIELGDPAGAQGVLDKIAVTNQIMLDGFQELEAVTDEVDAVNG